MQIQIFEALREGDLEIPRFAHFPLLVGAGGEALSKRLGTLGLGHLRECGYEAMAIAALLARLGTSDAVAPAASMAELLESFDLTHFSHASPHYDPAELDRLNAATLHDMAFETAAARLDGLDPALWEAVRPNLAKLSEAEAWKGIVAGPVDPVIEDRAFTGKAADLLPPEPWDETTWSTWIGAVKDETGAKGKALFMPLRKALTGLDHGPELGALLRLIGREKAAARLRGEAA